MHPARNQKDSDSPECARLVVRILSRSAEPRWHRKEPAPKRTLQMRQRPQIQAMLRKTNRAHFAAVNQSSDFSEWFRRKLWREPKCPRAALEAHLQEVGLWVLIEVHYAPKRDHWIFARRDDGRAVFAMSGNLVRHLHCLSCRRQVFEEVRRREALPIPPTGPMRICCETPSAH